MYDAKLFLQEIFATRLWMLFSKILEFAMITFNLLVLFFVLLLLLSRSVKSLLYEAISGSRSQRRPRSPEMPASTALTLFEDD